MLAFETIGSATIIAYDDGPVLTTDAWINDDAYFGAWTHDYEIPPAQMDAIRRAKYHWFSHGHPDHLNVDALPMLTGGQFLLSDHHGGRILRDLVAAGHDVRVLRDRVWEQRCRVSASSRSQTGTRIRCCRSMSTAGCHRCQRFAGLWPMRDPVGVLMTRFATQSEHLFRRFVSEDSGVFRAAKKAYYLLGRRG
ncbi:MAG TPA: hypothetical protein PJ986_04985 [Gammaproteobacteria bacterium]|nr:hypothetical protein [Gammaproteobacteria bacterium]